MIPVKALIRCVPITGLRRATPESGGMIRIAVLLSLLAISAGNARAWQSPAEPDLNLSERLPERPSDPEIVKRIDAAVYERTNSLARYTVQEQYDIYRNGEANPSAQMTVQAVYSYSNGKDYTLTAQSGSHLLRTVVLDKVLAEEREMAKASNRESVWVTSANYEMLPEPGLVAMSGRQCLIVDLKPRRKSPHLFTGKVWIDASDFSVLRLQGVPAQGLSIFTGQTNVMRDYARMDGFSMATHAEARAHSFLLGDTVMKIDYTAYQIKRTAPPAWVPSH
jgi:hypothetical protein